MENSSIRVKLIVNIESRQFTITPSNLNMSQADWDSMSEEEKMAVVIDYVDSVEQPHWEIVSFEETKR